MTVCIAAMCGPGIIFGTADRMKTADDVQFEPSAQKIFSLTTSIVVMGAGDTTFHAEIIQEIFPIVYERIQKEPDNWWYVKDVAELYLDFYNSIKAKRSESLILKPLGLNFHDFFARQKEMSPEFVTQVTQKLMNFQTPILHTIITGVDMLGTHIYIVADGTITCWDHIGFASVGSGSRHAESQFMLAGHAWNSPVPETLLLTYSAKKRSEVAPGVGKETDMFLIEKLGSFTLIGEEALKRLEKMYTVIRKKENLIIKKSNKEITSYVQEIAAAASSKQQTQSTKTEEDLN